MKKVNRVFGMLYMVLDILSFLLLVLVLSRTFLDSEFKPTDIDYLWCVLIASYCTFSSLLIRGARNREAISEASYKSMKSLKMTEIPVILIMFAFLIIRAF